MRRVLLAITLVSVLAAVPSTAGAASFSMGVSSAEVTSNSALLWTRAPKSGKAQLVVGINRKFTKTRLVKKLSATKGNDLTVQSRVRHLKPAKSYYYFFFQGKQRSDIGTFRTAPKPSASKTIKFAVKFHDIQVDLGTKGPSAGDERILSDTLLDSSGAKIGHDAGVCTFTSLAPPEAVCSISFFLSGGQIAIQFLNTPPPHKVAAIVGGTGAYRGARGEAVIVESPKQTGTVTFRLTT